MTNANECTCPSGDGSLRHPCPAHPAVEQAGGDERVVGWRERILAAHPNSDPGFWPEALLVEHMAAEIADLRAALAQPSQAPADEKPGDSILCSGCFAKGVGPEHFDEAGKCLVRQQTEPLGAEFAQVLSDNLPELLSTAQAEQAEAERPEVVAVMESNGAGGKRLAQRFPIVNVFVGDELMTVAQHERIVGELRTEIAMLRSYESEWELLLNEHEQQRDAALAEVERLTGVCASLDSEKREMEHKRDAIIAMHDAALARVSELEKQEPVGEVRESGGTLTAVIVRHSYATKLPVGTKLYAAPVAQAQQLHDLDKQCRDDVARALGLRPSQERGFAWSYLLASIKSCVKASEDTAQAQHSVPDLLEWAVDRWHAEVSQRPLTNVHRRALDDTWRQVIRRLGGDTGLLCGPSHDELLAAAPGKEVGHE
ncbi:TPA: hypothetical protein ACUUCJ_001237 [Pseudomonas aeruginosa]